MGFHKATWFVHWLLALSTNGVTINPKIDRTWSFPWAKLMIIHDHPVVPWGLPAVPRSGPKPFSPACNCHARAQATHGIPFFRWTPPKASHLKSLKSWLIMVAALSCVLSQTLTTKQTIGAVSFYREKRDEKPMARKMLKKCTRVGWVKARVAWILLLLYGMCFSAKWPFTEFTYCELLGCKPWNFPDPCDKMGMDQYLWKYHF